MNKNSEPFTTLSMELNKTYCTDIPINFVRPDMFTQTHNFWLGHLDARDEFTLMQGFDNPLESIFFIEQEIRKAAKPYPRYLHACSMLLQWNPHDIYAPQTQLNLRLIDYSNAITAEINPRQNNLRWKKKKS